MSDLPPESETVPGRDPRALPGRAARRNAPAPRGQFAAQTPGPVMQLWNLAALREELRANGLDW